jgi:hypothetical protein
MESYWEGIERDFEKHTLSRFSATRRDENIDTSLVNQLSLPRPPVNAYSKVDSRSPIQTLAIEDNKTRPSEDYYLRELALLRQTSKQQSEQISAIEALILGQNKTSNFVQSDIIKRIELLETDHNLLPVPRNTYHDDLSAASHKTKREYDEMIYSRLTAIEEAQANIQADDKQLENIGKVLGTTIDHLYTVSGVAEASREISGRSSMFIDILLRALCSLGNADIPTSSLSFLSALASVEAGDVHRELLKELLKDSLQTAIASGIKSHMGSATECLNELFSPRISCLQDKLDTAVEDMQTKIQALSVKMEHGISRVEERLTRLQSSQQLLSLETKSVIAEMQRVNDSERNTLSSLGDIVAMHTAKMQTIDRHESGISHHAQESNDLQFKAIQFEISSLQAAQAALQTNFEDSLLDFHNTLEKLRSSEKDNKSSIDTLAALTKEEAVSMKQANQKMQIVLEQQTGELYKRFSKLESKLDKAADKKEKIGGTDGNLSSVKVDLENMRQSLANSVFDLDDMKTQLQGQDVRLANVHEDQEKHRKDMTQQLFDLKSACMLSIDSFGSRITHMQEAMDTLQDELVALAVPVERAYPKKGAGFKETEAGALSDVNETSFKVHKDNELSTGVDVYMSSVSASDAISVGGSVDNSNPNPKLSPSVLKSKNLGMLRVDTESSVRLHGALSPSKLSSPDQVSIAPESPSVWRPVVVSKIKSDSPQLTSSYISDKEGKPSSASGESGTSISNSSSTSSRSSGESDSDSETASFSSEASDEDILGKYPPPADRITQSGQTLDISLSSPGPSPSEVLAEQLRLRATYEREQALRNVTAKRLSTGTGSVGLTGPPVGAIQGGSARLPGSPTPVLSGTLLSGRRNANNIGHSGPGSRNNVGGKPIFDPTFGEMLENESNVHVKESSASTTLIAARRTAAAANAAAHATSYADKKDTIQCSHCLRRISRLEIVIHNTSCELRTELCPNGCGAKIRAIKLDVHLKECSKR